MNETHQIVVKDGITLITFLVDPDCELIKTIFHDLAERYPYDKKLWDVSNVNLDLNFDELKEIASEGKATFKKPNKSAVFTYQDLAFGEMRQLEVFREESGHSELKVFRNLDQAVMWLEA